MFLLDYKTGEGHIIDKNGNVWFNHDDHCDGDEYTDCHSWSVKLDDDPVNENVSATTAKDLILGLDPTPFRVKALKFWLEYGRRVADDIRMHSFDHDHVTDEVLIEMIDYNDRTQFNAMGNIIGNPDLN